MRFTLRHQNRPEDYLRIAEMLTAVNPEPWTVEDCIEWDESLPEGAVIFERVAADETDRAIAYGNAVRYPWANPGLWEIFVMTDPALRGKGAGAALLTEAEAFAASHGATRLIGSVREGAPEALRFLEKRGYQRTRHLFESVLDLAAFEASRFAGVVEAARASGIRFFTIADAPGEETYRTLYELVKRNIVDFPGREPGEFIPYEVWRKDQEGRSDRPDLTIIAVDGDQYVGTTRMSLQESGRIYTYHTSVIREYRGRRIALALKLLSIEVARRYGAPAMRTNNDSNNQPMLALNQLLGYQPEPGNFRVEKRL